MLYLLGALYHNASFLSFCYNLSKYRPLHTSSQNLRRRFLAGAFRGGLGTRGEGCCSMCGVPSESGSTSSSKTSMRGSLRAVITKVRPSSSSKSPKQGVPCAIFNGGLPQYVQNVR